MTTAKESRVDDSQCDPPSATAFPENQPVPAVHQDDQGDWVCPHGVAMDVHCCGCHSGFVFDLEHICEFVLPIKSGTLGVPLHLRREPTPKDIADPRFDVIWELIKRVDVDFRNGLFSGATGNDVCAVLDALGPVQANAHDRLTAVNADLLAALKVIAALDPYRGMYHCVFCGLNVVLRHEEHCAWKLATLAIAKAEGR